MDAGERAHTDSLNREVAEVATVAILYYLTGRLGRMAAPPPGIATVVWPPSGVALAALMILGNRVWPGIWLGAFLSNNWAVLQMGGLHDVVTFLLTGIGIDTGATLQALAGATMLRRFVPSGNPFERFRDSLIFVAVALSVSLIGSGVGVASLSLGGYLPWSAASPRWWTWWIGEAGGLLVTVPLVVVWWYPGQPLRNRARWLEALLLLIGIAAFSTMIFVWWHPSRDARYPADLLLLPMVAWVAYRFTMREASLIAPLVLAIALWGTLHGGGPYRGATPFSTLPVIQGFIGILSMLSITIGAVITERKHTGDALRESEHWLRESQRISRIGSYVLDCVLGRWTSSETLDEILGIDRGYPHDVGGLAALVHADDRDAVMKQMCPDSLKEERRVCREFRVVRPADGGVRWVLCQGALAGGGDDLASKLAGTMLDITERRNMEAQLLQAQKMESIGRLAGGVAHDFNNLLTVINGYGELVLSRMPQESPLYPQVQEIRKAGERAGELTRQLLAFGRKQVLQPKVVNLNDIVRDSDKMLRRVIGEDIELVSVLDPALRPVEADPVQLHQVILNLAANARDAMPDGGRLTIETANTRAGAVSLTVRDTGHGMDAATMEHAFEPFFTTKDVGKGTGLGLATVYGIVQQSAGQISVRSEPGRGAAFTVHLPGVDGIVAAEVEAPPVPVGSGTVLLAEDEEGVRMFIAASLERQGYRVLMAASGEEALRVAHECRDPIHLLITDVVMPRMKGPELASRLLAGNATLKVLYISGYSQPGAFERGSNYLQKPFASQALLQAVKTALG
ncbi:MAG TPA: MASE1 domain-containing protein [Bryobacteraceae bacterium]|nr:MASE1 domain-containing protein [Bryobacteraceae bacterium]